MDEEVVACVAFFVELVVTKWHVADGHVEKAVGEVGLLEATDGDIGLWVELLGDTTCYAVQLHTVELGACHTFGEHPQEIACTTGRL